MAGAWTIKCWWANNWWNLWNGSTTTSYTPVQVSGINNAVQLSVWEAYSCAVLSNWTVKCWGYHWPFILYNSNWSEYSDYSPVQISWITNAVQVSAWRSANCAVLNNWTIKCWWINDWWSLWDWTTNSTVGHWTSAATSVQVSGISNAVQVSAWYFSSCALLNNWIVKCWWDNFYWELWNWSNTTSYTPVQVSGISNAVQVANGSAYSCAVLSNWTVKCWGSNGYGQLWNNSTTNSNVPVLVSWITNAVHVSLDQDEMILSKPVACALLADWTVKCWWNNDYGQLWNGNNIDQHTPISFLGATNVKQVSPWHISTCVLLSGWTMKCVWNNDYGQLWNGNNYDSYTPVQVSNLTVPIPGPVVITPSHITSEVMGVCSLSTAINGVWWSVTFDDGNAILSTSNACLSGTYQFTSYTASMASSIQPFRWQCLWSNWWYSVNQLQCPDGYNYDTNTSLCKTPTVYSPPTGWGWWCFVAWTLITLADWTRKQIESIVPGDIVLGPDGVHSTVQKIMKKFYSRWIYSINGSNYFVSDTHPFMTTEWWKSFYPAWSLEENPNLMVSLLHIGDVLVTDHGLEKILSVSSINSPQYVYNFEVDGGHMYYANWYLVHNKNGSSVNCAWTLVGHVVDNWWIGICDLTYQ